MRPITDELIQQAAAAPRGRVPYNFHEAHEPVQRMINALTPGTYVTPHKHEDPDKVELIAMLAGRAALFHYSPDGTVEQVFIIDAAGPLRGVDIPARVYHNFVAITSCAVLEIIQGPYNPATHKRFAPWAPTEGSPDAPSYLTHLEALIQKQIAQADAL